MINKIQLKERINDLKQVAKETNISSIVQESNLAELIFQEACSYQRGLMCGESRVSNYSNQKKSYPKANTKESLNENKLVTDNQIKLMNKLKIEVKKDLTSKEASESINKKIPENKLKRQELKY
jgi:hypothetical protein